MDIVRQILEKWDLVALFIAVNLALGGLAQLFRWISTKTAATWDDDVANKLSAASNFVAKVIDWLHGNAEHKDAETPPKQ